MPKVQKIESSLDHGVLVSPQQGVDIPTEDVESIEERFPPRSSGAAERVSEGVARSRGELKAVMAGVR